MEHKHAIVVDKYGHRVEFVLVAMHQEDGLLVAEPLSYEMQPGEALVYDGVQEALGMCKPRWDGHVWHETATEAELEAARPPEPPPPEPDPRDLAIAELSVMMAETQMALADVTMLIGGEINVDA